MRVRVRFFAEAREALGRAEIERELPCGTTAGELAAQLVRDFPSLRSQMANMKMAVNCKYARAGTELQDGDEVACLPPVGGG